MRIEFVQDLFLMRHMDGNILDYPGSLVLPEDYCILIDGADIYVPAGFTTDLASFPKTPFFGITLGNKIGPSMEAAIVHDFLYSPANGYTFTRKEADQAFYDILRVSGVHPLLCRFYYWGVRAFGWLQYKGYIEGGRFHKKRNAPDD